VSTTSIYHPKPGASFWVVRAGEEGRHTSDFETGGLATVRFDHVGDASGMSSNQLKKLIVSERPDKKGKAPTEAAMLYRFANVIRVGDIVITADGATRELLFGEVSGPYEYHETPPVSNFRHIRKVKWLGRYSRDELPQKLLPGLGLPLTIYEPLQQNQLRAVLAELFRRKSS
jgi:restriction system protein